MEQEIGYNSVTFPGIHTVFARENGMKVGKKQDTHIHPLSEMTLSVVWDIAKTLCTCGCPGLASPAKT